MNVSYQTLFDALAALIPPERLFNDPLRTLAYGSDASFYRLIPQIVVRVETEAEVVGVLAACHTHGLPVTFRAAGTSLSGQAITDSVLIQLGNGWTDIEILGEGAAIRLQPGVIGAHANARLAPLGRKIGPDPASINSCMIGGIAANNASGMCCGTAQNSYRTVRDMRLVLADGAILDTADDASRQAFTQNHGALLGSLAALGQQTRANQALADRIRHKYRMKNTTGYSLNALVDYEDPIDILKHLMIGSEGTLGFISSITYDTVPEHPHKAAALLYFSGIRDACQATLAMKPTPVAAVELLDRASLRAVEAYPGMPPELQTLPEGACALLVDVRAASAGALDDQVQTVTAALGDIPLLQPALFTTDQGTYERYWNVRKGIFPAIGAQRVIGTTVVNEDVAFPIEQLVDGVLALRQLLNGHGYADAVILGHALEGNLHFVFPQNFDDPAQLQRYGAFMEDLAQLVAGRFGGSLKAEHGTGRNMAPFVEQEWGSDAYALMQSLKHLLDPLNLLNPDVILSDNRCLHLQNIKPMPAAHELVDTCIECGFCESVCPSRRLTLTPRQRIVLWREIKRLEQVGDQAERLQALRDSYQYDGLDTCAGDGLCATRCPVGINTGDLVRALRADHITASGGRAEQFGHWTALHFAGVTRAVRVGLRLANAKRSVVGDAGMRASVRMARPLTGGQLSHWSPAMPQAAARPQQLIARLKPIPAEADKVVYLPACVTRTMGASRADADQRSVPEVTLSVLRKAGYEVILPENLDSLCCGMPFQSKGLLTTADEKRDAALAALRQASNDGQWPILCDTSPCTMRLQEAAGAAGLTIREPAAFIQQEALPRLTIHRKAERVALHVTCSSTRMGLGPAMVALANACADAVVLPASVTCCGFAGDKGFSTPELNASALQDLKREVAGCSRGFSNSRTCEIGLAEHSGLSYQSVLYLVDEVSERRG